MLNKKRQKNIVEKLVKESFDGQGRLKEGFAKSSVNLFKKLPLSQGISYLSLYYKGLKREISKTTLEIFSSTPLSSEQKNKIIKTAGKSFRINKTETALDTSLLGGLRIKIGDMVFDDSIYNKIGQMKGMIND